MAAEDKRGIGTVFALLGISLLALGLIFLVAGNVPIGVPFLGSGCGMLVIGIAIRSKNTK